MSLFPVKFDKVSILYDMIPPLSLISSLKCFDIVSHLCHHIFFFFKKRPLNPTVLCTPESSFIKHLKFGEN